jgi:hypothetical protein
VWIIPGKRGKGDRGSGEGDLKTTQKLRKRLSGLWISSDRIVMDDGDSFLAVYGEDHHDCRKKTW